MHNAEQVSREEMQKLHLEEEEMRILQMGARGNGEHKMGGGRPGRQRKGGDDTILMTGGGDEEKHGNATFPF